MRKHYLSTIALLIMVALAAGSVDSGNNQPTGTSTSTGRSGGDTSTPADGSRDVHGAWAYTQLFVEERLKSPSTAKFRFGGYRDVTDLGSGLYSVDSYVDSQNSFGATIRTHFSVKIRRNGSKWILESLEVDE